MRNFCCLVLLAILTLGLAGCGQKGPLRRPEATSLDNGLDGLVADIR
jgi:predicted small lipoprotein YifL